MSAAVLMIQYECRIQHILTIMIFTKKNMIQVLMKGAAGALDKTNQNIFAK